MKVTGTGCMYSTSQVTKSIKKKYLQATFDDLEMIIQIYSLLICETAFKCLYPQKIISTMGFPTKYLPGPTLLNQTEPKD